MARNRPTKGRRRTLKTICADILSDGEWHTVRELFWKTESMTRPEVAIRYYHSYPRRGRPRVHEEPLDEQLRKGKMRVLYIALQALGVEYRGDSAYDPEREVRLDPAKGDNKAMLMEYGGAAVRALMSISAVNSAIRASAKANGLTPLQRFWVGLAVQQERDATPDASG